MASRQEEKEARRQQRLEAEAREAARNMRPEESALTLDSYQLAASTTAIYPGKQNSIGLCYVTLGLNGEAGEFAEKLKKTWRDDGVTNGIPRAVNDAMAKELGDVLWYVAMCAEELGYTLSEVAEGNLHKLQQRHADQTLHGSGDDR